MYTFLLPTTIVSQVFVPFYDTNVNVALHFKQFAILLVSLVSYKAQLSLVVPASHAGVDEL